MKQISRKVTKRTKKLTAKQRSKMVLDAICAERDRQDGFVETGVFPFNCSSSEVSDKEKLPILGEEFGEVCRAVYEREHQPRAGSTEECYRMCDERREHLRDELIQLAAVAKAWAESLTR